MGRFPGSNASAGLAVSTQIVGNYVSQVDAASGRITATYSSTSPRRANTVINGATLTYSAVTHEGSISWECNKSGALLDKWVPQVCRN
jgi:type IV pilus assembly protein PilA